MKGRVICTLAAAAVVVLLAPVVPADGAYPGRNGKIAYWQTSPSTMWTINPDATGNAQIGPGAYPRFSPDGRKFAFIGRNGCCTDSIAVMNEDGSNSSFLSSTGGTLGNPSWSPDQSEIAYDTWAVVGDPQEILSSIRATGTGGDHIIVPVTNDFVDNPGWSPRGDRILFRKSGDIWTVPPDGSDQQQITSSSDPDYEPDWSPDGTRVAFIRGIAGNDDVYSMNADGSGITRLTDDPAREYSPAWSPDGQSIAFASDRDGNFEIYRMDADGTDETRITTDPATQIEPSWQPLPYTGYARPKGATPLRVPLVISYKNCTTPNEQHGPPLAFPSCSPPVQESDWVTTGTADSNGQATQFVGSVRLDTVPGNPSTLTDEADVKAVMDITDVRRKDNMADYVGGLQATIPVRITDRFNSSSPGGGSDPATIVDIPFPVQGTCTATPDPAVGSTCGVVTSFDAIVPGGIAEGKRSIWQMGQVEVSDGGEDGNTSTAPNTRFARQGIFVP
jgi:hypothetical protein